MSERMRSRPAMSLQSRVLRIVIAILLLGGLLVGVTAWVNGQQAARDAYDRILIGAASDIAESVRIIDGQAVVDLPVSAFELLAQAPDDRVSYAVRGPGGALITGFEDAEFHPAQNPRGQASPFFDSTMHGEPARFVEVTRRFAERDFSGSVRISVGQTLRARQVMAFDLMLDAMVPILAAGLVLLLTSYFAIRSAVRPLDTIAANLRDRDPYDLTPIPTDNVPSEVEVMLSAMNRFMGRLDRQMGVMRNLISDTAHQLRTPVAAIRVQAESILSAPDAEPSRRTVDRLVTRTRTLGRLLDQLLSRAMVIHRTDNLPRTVVDLRDIALEVLEQRDHEVLSPGNDVQLVIGEDPICVLADPFSLTQAASNLLSNAMTHGRAPIRIGVGQTAGTAHLWIADAGDGPPPEIAAKLGRRFERSSTSGEDSRGLGMSIVYAVATAFDGRIDMARNDDGFRITMVFPLVQNTGEFDA
jgi:two-component system, OmpR family, sensor histidine kinase TctE